MSSVEAIKKLRFFAEYFHSFIVKSGISAQKPATYKRNKLLHKPLKLNTMGYMGFGMQKWISTQKPKTFKSTEGSKRPGVKLQLNNSSFGVSIPDIHNAQERWEQRLQNVKNSKKYAQLTFALVCVLSTSFYFLIN